MNLSFGIAVAGNPDGMTVRDLATNSTIATSFSPAMRDRIRVRAGDLVVVDRDKEQTVWRWWGGTVERVDGETAVVSRRVSEPTPDGSDRGETEAAIAPGLADLVLPGARAYFNGHPPTVVIIAVATESGLAGLDRLAADQFPLIERTYAEMEAAG